jgi:hypothetical protein
MMIKREEYLGSFRCQASDGRCVVVHIYEDVIDAASRGHPTGEIRGLKSLRSEDGLAVNRVEKGRYEIAVTGEILTSDDANAP